MPVFDGRGLVPPAPSEAPVPAVPVVVSSDDSGEEEEYDSAATLEGSGETSPPCKADLLRALPDDDAAGDHPLKEVPAAVGGTTRSRVSPSGKPTSGVPTKSRSSLISRSDAPASPPPGATLASRTLGARAPAPQAARPLSSALLKRRRDYTAMDQPTSSSKKKKEGVATSSGTQQPGTAAPPLAQKGVDGAHTSSARSSSRGPEERPQERATPKASSTPEALVPSPPAGAPQAAELPASSSAAINLQVMATMLPPFSASPLAAAASEKDKQAVAQAAAAREVALKDTGAAQDHCRSLEAELETMRNERAAKARGRQAAEEKMKAREDAVRGRDAELEQLAKAQATERSRLEKLEQEMKAEKAELEAKVKVLAEGRVAFKSLEEKSRVALRALYEKGLEEPLATDDEGPTQLLPHLVAALEDVVDGIDPLVEGEARALSSAALTRVFSHLHLCDHDADLDELLEPVDDERCTAAAEAMKSQVEALLKKFRAFDLVPSTGGAAGPATPAGGAGEGNVAVEGAPLASDGGVQG
nr:nucleoporin NSP1-like [Aegilops tauschii subsp. strangulata]